VNLWGFFRGKFYEINWLLPALIYILGLIGVAVIFAATEGVWDHGAKQHLIRLILAGGIMLILYASGTIWLIRFMALAWVYWRAFIFLVRLETVPNDGWILGLRIFSLQKL